MDKKVLDKLEILEKVIAKIASGMITKQDAKNFLTKQDAKNFATKDDLKKLKNDLLQKIDDAEIAIIARVDKFKADKGEIVELEGRVKRLERKMAD